MKQLQEMVGAQAVYDFASASLHGNPLLYPGQRPQGSYVTDGNHVVAFSSDMKLSDDGVSVDDYLAEQGVARIAERIPLVSFGSNLCPGSLRAKFAKAERAGMQILPVVAAVMPGHDVVWSGGPGVNGNFVAYLYDGPEVADTTVAVGINYVTRQQLLMLHATELNYDLVTTSVQLDTGEAISAYIYAGKDSVWFEGSLPVAVAAVPAQHRQLPDASTQQMLDRMLMHGAVRSALTALAPDQPVPATAEDYIGWVRSQTPDGTIPSPKLRAKQRMHQVIADLGLSKIIEVTAFTESWTNPSTLRTAQGGHIANLYVLPSSELSPTDLPQPARTRVLHGLAEHFHRHYLQAARGHAG